MRTYKILLGTIILATIIMIALITLADPIWYSCQKVADPPRNVSFRRRPFQLQNDVENIDFENDGTRPSQYNNTCAKFPKLFDIKFASDYWQMQKTPDGILQFLNAYLDHRVDGAIRILSMYNVYDSDQSFYCQVWYDEDKPIIVKSEKLLWAWRKGWGGDTPGTFHPYIITCLVSEEKIPKSVSIVDAPCTNATNNLKINHKELREFEQRKKFVVCVKGLEFPDQNVAARLVEWIELLFLLGAEKINFYKYNVHKTIQEILDFYVNNKNIEVTPITVVGGYSNAPRLQSKYLHEHLIQACLYEVICFNDCLYKHLQEYKFVVILDTDEVIVPRNGTWNNLISSIEQEGTSSYLARNVYFLDSHQDGHGWFQDIPHFMHILQHVYRAQNYTPPGHYVKGFHDTRKVVALHNHYPFSCIANCITKDIDLDLAHSQHYRNNCVADVSNCGLMKNNSILDNRIWNFKDNLSRNVIQVLLQLNLLDFE